MSNDSYSYSQKALTVRWLLFWTVLVNQKSLKLEEQLFKTSWSELQLNLHSLCIWCQRPVTCTYP